MTVSAGLDVHKQKCHGVIVDEDGEVLKDEEFENSLTGVKAFFQGFLHADAVIEASYSWRPAYERLEEIGIEPKLAHPREVEAIASSEIKTDSIDARTLAHLLRTGFVPEAWVPPKETKKLREKLRRRAYLIWKRTGFKNKIKTDLAKHGIRKDFSYSEENKKWLRSLDMDSVEDYLDMIVALNKPIERITKEIKKRSQGQRRRKTSDDDPWHRIHMESHNHVRNWRHRKIPEFETSLFLFGFGSLNRTIRVERGARIHNKRR